MRVCVTVYAWITASGVTVYAWITTDIHRPFPQVAGRLASNRRRFPARPRKRAYKALAGVVGAHALPDLF